MEGREKMTDAGSEKTDLRDTHGNWQGLNGDWETTGRQEGWPTVRKRSGASWNGGTPAYTLRPPHHALLTWKGPTLV
jgi:hypothetical protein